MTTRSVRALRQALLAKWFRRSDSHHQWYRLHVAGEATKIKTFLSHGIAEYGDKLQSDVAR